jgi:predicted Rossmann fold flavoprotein
LLSFIDFASILRMNRQKKCVIIGGGAAGIFAAIACAEQCIADRVLVIEKTAQLLSKVRISGGGRCNVTHACFEPKKLVTHYPRGSKELLGPFSRFAPRDTIAWFEERGVALKVEKDGRMFPTTNSSETIIDCLLLAASKAGVEIIKTKRLETITKNNDSFTLDFAKGEAIEADALLLATGSSPQGFRFAEALGHSIVPAVPSLFTFNIPTSPLLELSGASVDHASISIEGFRFESQGPLLLTHWGFSGPAALKLSAWAARHLHEEKYQATILINWAPLFAIDELMDEAMAVNPNSQISSTPLASIPKKLWRRLCELTGISTQSRYRDLGKKKRAQLKERLTRDRYSLDGKTTYKQEFVTSGGITCSEVNFKTMESRICSGLYFGGEILNVDGVTGGFNFQNAWTSGYIAGNAMAERIKDM